jgi:hypothetical protein
MRDFPKLTDAQKRAEKAVDVLHSAISQLTPPRDGENWETLALRLRGASVLCHTAGLELALVSGEHSAAHNCAVEGLLDEGSESDG